MKEKDGEMARKGRIWVWGKRKEERKIENWKRNGKKREKIGRKKR